MNRQMHVRRSIKYHVSGPLLLVRKSTRLTDGQPEVLPKGIGVSIGADTESLMQDPRWRPQREGPWDWRTSAVCTALAAWAIWTNTEGCGRRQFGLMLRST